MIFLASLSDYDKICIEDDKTNRMIESIGIFGDTINNEIFCNQTIYLVFTKTDILKKIGKENRFETTFSKISRWI